RLRLIAEAELQRDLIVRDAAILDVAAHLRDLEPVQVADRLAGDIDRLIDGVLDALVRGPDDFAQRIDVVHGDSPGPAFWNIPESPNPRPAHAVPPRTRGFLCRRRRWRQWGRPRHIAAIFRDRPGCY